MTIDNASLREKAAVGEWLEDSEKQVVIDGEVKP